MLAGSDLGLFLAEISGKGCSGENAKKIREVFYLHNKDLKREKLPGGLRIEGECLGVHDIQKSNKG